MIYSANIKINDGFKAIFLPLFHKKSYNAYFVADCIYICYIKILCSLEYLV